MTTLIQSFIPAFLCKNIEKIGKLFPNVVVETKNGMAIDFDRLKQKLSDDIIEGQRKGTN